MVCDAKRCVHDAPTSYIYTYIHIYICVMDPRSDLLRDVESIYVNPVCSIYLNQPSFSSPLPR